MSNSEQNHSGYLKLYLGPMYSGKSSSLLREATLHSDIGHKVLFINHSDDQRNIYGDSFVSSHHSLITKLPDKIKGEKTQKLSTISNIDDYQVIAIDEGQFYPDLVENVKLWVTKHRKIVLCAGLNGDIFQKSFGHMLELIPFADDVLFHQAKCHQCLKILSESNRSIMVNAPFTARLSKSTEQKLIGASETYIALCRFHYEKHNK